MSGDRTERLGAEYLLVRLLSEARADLPLLLRVRVRNTGAATWPDDGARPVNLAYHWLDAHGQVIDFEGVRAALPALLRPGETAELDLHVEPPPRAGDYQLALDLVEEGVGWFSLRGVAPLIVSLTVAPGPRNVPRACIVSSLCLPNDAVGNHVVNQLRFFLARGYQTMVLVEDVDQRHPPELRQYMAALTYADLQSGRETPLTRRALAHLRSSDIYIFHYAIHYSLFKTIADIGRGIVIMDYHGVTPLHLWDADGAGYNGLVDGQWQIELVRYADYAIAHSSYTRDELLATSGISPERVYVMPYAVALERFRPGPRDPTLLARYSIEDGPVLLYVGRMAANKRIEDLVHALPYIRAQLPSAVLLLIGDDRTPTYAPVAERARHLAATLGVADGVILTGQVPDTELVAHYQLADLFITASLHEGFCIPVIEAMACGVPTVGANATALPETIGATGVTFQPRDPSDLACKVLEILSAWGDGRGLMTRDRFSADKVTR